MSTEINQRLEIEGVRCGKGGTVCEVRFPGDITVAVRLVHVPNYVIVYARRPVPGMSTRPRHRVEYVYSCTAAGKLEFRRRTALVRIILIDPNGSLKTLDKLREEVRASLEKKFNDPDPNWSKWNFFRFRVEYLSNEPSDKDKAGFGKLDFPVYLLGTQRWETVQGLMEKHRIPKTIEGQDYYDLAKDCWEKEGTRGCGIPSGGGGRFRKVGFIKTHRVFRDGRRDPRQAFVNVTAHETGHMGNLPRHSEKGLMKYPVPLDADIDFDVKDKYLFLSNLQRLRDQVD